MPLIVPAPAVVEARVIGTYHGQQVITTFHLSDPNGSNDARTECLDILTGVETTIWNNMRQACSTELTGVFLEAQYVHPIRSLVVRRTPTQVAGGRAGTGLPSGTSIVVQRVSEQAGHEFRGRIYVPAVVSGDVLNSVLTAAALTAFGTPLRNAVSANVVTILPATYPQVIWSRKAPARITPIFEGRVDSIIRYQRRREVGVGV